MREQVDAVSEIVENILNLVAYRLPEMLEGQLTGIKTQIQNLNSKLSGLETKVNNIKVAAPGGGPGGPPGAPPPGGPPGAPPPGGPPGAPPPGGPPGAPPPGKPPGPAKPANPVSLRASIMGELKSLFAKRRKASEG